MARCPLVKPATRKLPLSQNDWVEVKQELTSGEHRRMFLAQLNSTELGSKPTLDLKNVGVSRVLGYVVDWSFVGFDDKPLPVTAETLDKFDGETFQELLAAIDTHHEAWEKAVDARKNAQTGATVSSTI